MLQDLGTNEVTSHGASAQAPSFPHGARRILLTKGNASREKHWWKTGTDRLASHGLDTEVWVSLKCCPPSERVLHLEKLLKLDLNSESLQDLLDMKAFGVEDAYWPGTESDLIGIPHFPDVIYATVTDQTATRAWELVSITTTPREQMLQGQRRLLGGLLGQGQICRRLPGPGGLAVTLLIHCYSYRL